MSKVTIPADGEKITLNADGSINVPAKPIITYIEGDGIGSDITPAMIRVVDAAVEKAYGGAKKISWMEVYAGEKATRVYDKDTWLPQETLDYIKEYVVSIKGPLTTPIGGGIRSLNVALRQQLDLYICERPVRWFEGVPSPVKHPDYVDMVIFRENSEDIYAGIEWAAEMGVKKIRFDKHCGIGIKPVSKEGTQRLVKAAIQYAIDNDRKSVTLVHKGNIMKFTEGAFKNWGYEVAKEQFGGELIDQGPWMKIKNPKNGHEIVIKDCIAEYDVIATLNLNGDYMSDALAAQVGGIGIAPGANIGDTCAIFEATHGTAPKYTGMDKVNPGSIILSAEMMLRHMRWNEAADLIIKGVEGAIKGKRVTYDFARLMEGATEVKCSEFATEIIKHM